MIQIMGYPTLQHGLEYLKKYVKEKEENGEQTLILSEDRLTLLAEKAVCDALGGSFLTSVSTFARFLSGKGKTLSKQGSVMVIGKLLTEYAENLHCFSAHTFAKNGAQAVYEMISQLSASKITPQMLLESNVEQGLLKDKLSDLAYVYQLYLDFLAEKGYYDESSYLSLLPQILKESPLVRGKNVVFLGFHSFTSQALDGVRAACESAKNVLGLLPAGKGEIYCNQASAAFKEVCQEYGDVKITQLKITDENKRTSDVLREKLYDPTVFSSQFQPLSCNAQTRVHSFLSREEELSFVCARIAKHVATGGRYSDIAVFLPDFDSYSLLLNQLFHEYKIPYYADFKRPLSSHPFAYFLFSLLRVAAENASPNAVQALASSPYFGDSGEYRNYLAKFCNYRGGAKRAIKTELAERDYSVEYLEQMRARLLSALEVLPRKAKGADYCVAVKKIYQLFDVQKKTEILVNACEDDLQKKFLARMDKELDAVLSETQSWLGSFPLTATEFCDILKNGLLSCEVSLLPLTLDEVFVGDLAQSRTAGTPLVFALGLNDSVPTRGEDTALLSDQDIKKLDQVQVRIEPSVAQVNARTKEVVCLNLCSFEKELYASYSADGQDTANESEILRYIKRIFKDLPEQEELFAYRVCRPTPALNVLLKQRDEYIEGKTDREHLSTLYSFLTDNAQTQEQVKAYFTPKDKSDFLESGERLFFAAEGVSPTLLEKYHDCPYKNFTERGLKLKEREEAAVLVTDTGILVHSVLEETAKNYEQLQTEETCRKFAYETAATLLEKPKYNALTDTASGQYTKQRLLEECAEIAAQMYKQIKDSNFKVKYTEHRCTLPQEGLFGTVDRVDECGEYVRIIDYKTGSIDASAEKYYVGTKTQLQLYMSAVAQGKIPAGIYYFPASLKFHKEEEEPFRMSGFMNGEKEVIQNSDLNLTEESEQKSRYIDASLGGKPSDQTMDEEDFRFFIDYSVLSARKSINELKKGFIAPTPYGKACDYCAYKGMCGSFGKKVERETRSSIKCKTIAEIVRRETEGD